MISRRGFTLVEMLVSILLFTVVSLAMVTILASASNLFRVGEAGRAASDTAMATISAFDEDLNHLVPGSAGGFWYSEVYNPNPAKDPGGNMVISFVISNPDPTAITASGSQARQLVIWWVDEKQRLHRLADNDPVEAHANDKRFAYIANLFASNGGSSNDSTVFTSGCLYLGVDLAGPHPGPLPSTGPWNTEPDTSTPPVYDPFPDSLRLTVVFAGSDRDAPRGTVIRDDGTSIQVTGLKNLPAGAGAMVRIGPGPTQSKVEWVEYGSFAKGRLQGPSGTDLVRARRRTDQVTHDRGEPVMAGQTYSLSRVLNR